MALYQVVDAMRRADADFAAAHGVHQTTDAEWDSAIEFGEDMLDELSTHDEQMDLFGTSTSQRLYSCRCRRVDHEHDPGCFQNKKGVLL